jgi:hypothetical protein
MNTAAYTITTTRQLVIPADNINRIVYLHALGTGTVYIGGANVTSANGMLTEKNAVPFEFMLPAGETLYAVTATGTEELRILTPSVD